MNDKIRAVIIDDEETAIDNLCFELKKYPWISVEGGALTWGRKYEKYNHFSGRYGTWSREIIYGSNSGRRFACIACV